MAKKGYVGIWVSLIIAIIAMIGCEFGEPTYDDSYLASLGTGGKQDASTGGKKADTVISSGGSSIIVSGSGGTVSTTTNIVAVTTGGRVSTGGMSAVSGMTTGGVIATGGTMNVSDAGGAISASTGGRIVVVTGGAKATGGTSMTGGVSTGGIFATGGAATGGATSSITNDPNFCGQVDAPPEAVKQTGPQANCYQGDWKGHVLADAKTIRLWIDVVADVPNSTAKILTIAVYGIRSDGTSELAYSGSPTWAGKYTRDPWFPQGLPNYGKLENVAVASDGVYTAFTNPHLLHLGGGDVPVGSYVNAFAMVIVQTTGDAKVMVGVDAWLDASTYGWEIGNSNWYSCLGGKAAVIVSYNKSLPDPCSNAIE